MAEEEVRVKITVVGSEKAKDDLDKTSKSTTGLTSALTKLIPGASDMASKLETAGGAVKALGPTMGVSADAAKGFAASMAAAALPLAAIVAVIGVATVAFTGLNKVMQFSMAEAEANEIAQAQLGAVIKSTGGVAGVSAEMINDLANELSIMSGVEDDVIVASSNLLLTFTNIGKDVFPQAQQAALDVSQAFGLDLSSASVMLGKALQEPATGMTALRRIGVSFSDQMIAAAQSMVEHGQTARAQALILGEVSRQVAGSAAAMGSTVTGESNKITNLLKNIGESFGNAFLPLKGDMLVIVREFLTTLTKTLEPAMVVLRNSLRDLQTWLRQPEMKAAIRDLSTSLAGLVGEVAVIGVQTLIDGIKVFFTLWKNNGPQIVLYIKSIVDGLVILAQLITRVMDASSRIGSTLGFALRASGGNMPGYASGVMNAPGGWAMVGERGPELMQVPRGANIYPSGSAPSAMGGGIKFYAPVTIQADSQSTVSSLMHQLEAAATATA